jgi:hypothetical protein
MSQPYFAMFVWLYEGTICGYASLWILCLRVFLWWNMLRNGVLLLCKIGGVVLGVFCHSFVKLIMEFMVVDCVGLIFTYLL